MNMLNQRVTQLHKLKSRSVALIPREGGGGGGGGGRRKKKKKLYITKYVTKLKKFYLTLTVEEVLI